MLELPWQPQPPQFTRLASTSCTYTSSLTRVTCGTGFSSMDLDVIAFSEEGQLEDLKIIHCLVQGDFSVSIGTYASLLKGCGRMRALSEGKKVHAVLIKNGLESNTFLGNTLVDMYAKCNSMLEAQQSFDRMPRHNVFSWSTIISAHANQGLCEDAVKIFQKMQLTNVEPNEFVYVIVLKACGSILALEQGKQIHSQIIKSHCVNVFLSNTLIDVYAKCGSIDCARRVFDQMGERDVVSWNAMVAGYAHHGLGEQAFALYHLMQQEVIEPSEVTFITILKACVGQTTLEQGKKIHGQIVERGFGLHEFLGNALIDMYANCGSLENARQVFNKLLNQDLVSWNTLIAGYAQQGSGEEALLLFELMQGNNINPNEVTYVSILKACANITALEKGQHFHAQIIGSIFDTNTVIRNMLIDMYAKCGSMDDARNVFNEMHERDVVSWNVIIAGYAQQGCGEKAFVLFEEMQLQGMTPDALTFVNIFKVCTSPLFKSGQQLHAWVIHYGFELDIQVGSALVHMYGKCGDIANARQVFNKMKTRDVVSWSTMIASSAQQGLVKESLTLFEQMQQECVKPNEVTLLGVLKVCADLAAADLGKQFHVETIKCGFESLLVVGNTLIDMYAKCGSLEDAFELFKNMPKRNVVSWTTIISGYAQHGFAAEVLKLFKHMQDECIRPNDVTMLGVITACSHAGLIYEGCYYFDSMIEDYGIVPSVDHYACMVDLLGRAGLLEEAVDLVTRMPFAPCEVVWTALLGACRISGYVELAKHVAQCVLKLNPQNAAAYVQLSIASDGWDNSETQDKLMQ